MIDKTEIVAKNYFGADCRAIAETISSLVKDAYIKGFQRGVEKARVQNGQSAYPTRADQFRSMTDEELASYFGGRMTTCPAEKRCSGMFSVKKCTLCWLAYLKEEPIEQ